MHFNSFLPLLQDSGKDHSKVVASALSQMGRQASVHMGTVARLLQDVRKELRTVAARALGGVLGPSPGLLGVGTYAVPKAKTKRRPEQVCLPSCVRCASAKFTKAQPNVAKANWEIPVLASHRITDQLVKL